MRTSNFPVDFEDLLEDGRRVPPIVHVLPGDDEHLDLRWIGRWARLSKRNRTGHDDEGERDRRNGC